MTALKGYQKKYLRGLAHGLRAIVQIGREGVTDGLIRAIDEGLSRHELIKVKFNDIKEKDLKEAISEEVAAKTGGVQVGMIGHTMILYRGQADPEKRKIVLPERESNQEKEG